MSNSFAHVVASVVCVLGVVLTGTALPAAQLGGFGCPMEGAPQVRLSDSVAPSGGAFDSTRAGGKKHGALDLNGSLGQSVFASLGGRAAVARTGWGPMGNTVILDHGAGAYTVYGHLEAIVVKEGVTVAKGAKIGTVGYSGNAEALRAAMLTPHLHFALIQAGQTGLADVGKPLRQMEKWGDFWQSLGADLTGAVNPVLFVAPEPRCWTGSPNVGSPEAPYAPPILVRVPFHHAH